MSSNSKTALPFGFKKMSFGSVSFFSIPSAGVKNPPTVTASAAGVEISGSLWPILKTNEDLEKFNEVLKAAWDDVQQRRRNSGQTGG